MKGFLATIGGVIAIALCPPLAPLVISAGLVGMTAWAVFSEDDDVKQKSLPTHTPDMSGIREEIGSLSAELPADVQNKLVEEISSRLKKEVCRMAGQTENCKVAIKRKGDIIQAFVSEDGEKGHLIEFALP